MTDLKQAQTQLIQGEKMASLGQLTAGIAHEIQNPLNFVNNFSEVNKELINEAVEELQIRNYELRSNQSDQSIQSSPLNPQPLRDLLIAIRENEEKINHHGKRADAIVKGMLQHSQTTKGQKEPTDINALADEYLRLSYHGLRAKDNTFNATIKTDFDESIGKINIIPQDIGRVILNLLNNAFYAVSERAKNLHRLTKYGAENLPGLSEPIIQNQAGLVPTYLPAVSISTKKIEDKVEISILDNGNGIPPQVLDKIFQPFFTTKPTGQGTGLGLSLAYDIITKGHGGSIKVQTNYSPPDTQIKDASSIEITNTGTVFIIQLSIQYP